MSVNDSRAIDPLRRISSIKDWAKSMQSITTIRLFRTLIRIAHANWAYVDRRAKSCVRMHSDDGKNNHLHRVPCLQQSICDSTNGSSTTISIRRRERLFWVNFSLTTISCLKWTKLICFVSDSSNFNENHQQNMNTYKYSNLKLTNCWICADVASRWNCGEQFWNIANNLRVREVQIPPTQWSPPTTSSTIRCDVPSLVWAKWPRPRQHLLTKITETMWIVIATIPIQIMPHHRTITNRAMAAIE